MHRSIIVVFIFISLALLGITPLLVQAAPINCKPSLIKLCRTVAQICQPITQIPVTINKPGVYCLRRHLTNNTNTGSMIEIKADNVTINLDGWTLDGTSAGSGTIAIGISAYNRKNITVQNGTVRGFRIGIDLNQGSGHVVKRLRAEGNTQVGIVMKSAGSLIRNNLILNTGGSTAGAVFAIPAGIILHSARTQVIDNQVINTNGARASYGIYVGPSSNSAVVHNNRVSNPEVQRSVTSYGIAVKKVGFAQEDIAISNNHVTRMTKGISYDLGTTGVYAHNIVLGCNTPFSGGTAVGSTNFSQ